MSTFILTWIVIAGVVCARQNENIVIDADNNPQAVKKMIQFLPPIDDSYRVVGSIYSLEKNRFQPTAERDKFIKKNQQRQTGRQDISNSGKNQHIYESPSSNTKVSIRGTSYSYIPPLTSYYNIAQQMVPAKKNIFDRTIQKNHFVSKFVRQSEQRKKTEPEKNVIQKNQQPNSSLDRIKWEAEEKFNIPNIHHYPNENNQPRVPGNKLTQQTPNKVNQQTPNKVSNQNPNKVSSQNPKKETLPTPNKGQNKAFPQPAKQTGGHKITAQSYDDLPNPGRPSKQELIRSNEHPVPQKNIAKMDLVPLAQAVMIALFIVVGLVALLYQPPKQKFYSRLQDSDAEKSQMLNQN